MDVLRSGLQTGVGTGRRGTVPRLCGKRYEAVQLTGKGRGWDTPMYRGRGRGVATGKGSGLGMSRGSGLGRGWGREMELTRGRGMKMARGRGI